MQCPNDKTEMEQGFLVNLGQNWAKGKPIGTGISEKVTGGKYIFAYRCPKCGKIELTTEPEE